MRRKRPIAFTLLELVLVLVIISIALASVTPSLGGWSRGMKLRTAGDELLAAARLARDRAVTDAAPHALVARPGGDGWTVERIELVTDGLFDLPPDAEDAASTRPIDGHALPEGWSFAIESPTGEPMTRVTFYPDGRGDAAVLRLLDDRGELVSYERESVVSGFLRRREGPR